MAVERNQPRGQQPPGRIGVAAIAPGMTTLSIPMPDDHRRSQAHSAPAADLPRRDSSLQHLTTRAAGGDEGAFAALHQRLGGGLFRLFMDRTGGRSELAEDFSQKTWVAVWQALWLQHMRSAGRANAHLDAAAKGMSAMALSTDPANETKLAEAIDSVRSCLRAGPHESGLTDEERWILRAASTGVTDRELAQRLGVAASTANARKQAAYDKLRRYLENKGHRTESSGQEAQDGE